MRETWRSVATESHELLLNLDSSPQPLTTTLQRPHASQSSMTTSLSSLSTPARPTPPTSRPTVPSPAHRAASRHSLYGTDDRVLLDPGSALWKVGFSGEPAPRAVVDVSDAQGRGIWEEEFEAVAEADGWGEERGEEGKREWGERVVDTRIGDRLRDVFAKFVRLTCTLPRRTAKPKDGWTI